MSDASQGPGWWLASDGKWYPPEQAAGAAAPPPPQMPPPGMPPPGMPPPGSPFSPPPPPMGAYAGPIGPPPGGGGMNGCLKWGLIIGAIVLVLGVGGCIVVAARVGDAVDDVDFNNDEEARDVDLQGCGRSSSGALQADLEVTNHSSKRSNYIIEVTFEDGAGNQIDTATGFVNALESSRSTEIEASSFTSTDFEGDFDCRVIGVERFSDEG